MTTVALAPPPILQFLNNQGQPAVGGSVLTQVGGVNYPTYQDAAGTIPLPNPIPLNSRGEISNASGVSCQLFLDTTATYTFTLFDASGNQLNQAASVTAVATAASVVAQFAALMVTLAAAAGAALIGWMQLGAGAILRTILDKLRDTVNAKDFGVKADGVTDDTAAMTAFLTYIGTVKAVGILPPGTILTTTVMNQPVGTTVVGAGSGGYTALTGASDGATIIQCSSTGPAWVCGAASILRDVQLRPTNYASVVYSSSSYPAGTNNATYGVTLSTSAWAINVTCIAFSLAGFYNPAGNATAKLTRCHAFNNLVGYQLNGTDGTMLDCVAMFSNGTANVDNTLGGFWKFIGNRIEWAARTGLIAGSECTGVGNIFDRNGGPALYLFDGNWGQVWTGNYFSRNGCGGDPSQGSTGLGRWAFSTGSDPSYVTTAAADSCHIKFGFMRGLVIVGNRFRPGQDDSNGGCLGPAYIYQVDGAVGATLLNDTRINNNAGDENDSIIGYNPAAYSGTGALATGTDTMMVSYLVNGFGIGPQVLLTNILKNRIQLGASSTTYAVPVPKLSANWIYIYARNGTNFGAISAKSGGNGTVGSVSISAPATDFGTITATATIAAGAASSPYDIVTFTFSTSCIATPTVVSA